MADVTLILPADEIPDGTTVRKPTGQVEYILKKSLDLHIPGDKRTISVHGIVFLVADGSINGMPDTSRLAVDMELQDAIDLLQAIQHG